VHTHTHKHTHTHTHTHTLTHTQQQQQQQQQQQLAEAHHEELQSAYASKEEEAADTAKALRRTTAKLEASQAAVENGRRDIQKVAARGSLGAIGRAGAASCTEAATA
jgi:hypothetical protein